MLLLIQIFRKHLSSPQTLPYHIISQPGYVSLDAGCFAGRPSPDASVLSLESSLSGWAWLLHLTWSQVLAVLNLEAIKNGQDLQMPPSYQGPAKIVVCTKL